MVRQLQSSALDDCVQAVRRFNRFYTRKIGVLQEGLLESSLSLTEARVLYELAHRTDATATDLRGELGLDAGYVSRILQSFQKRGWIQRKPSKEDGRRHLLSLTRSGRTAFEPLDRRARRRAWWLSVPGAELEAHRQAAAAAGRAAGARPGDRKAPRRRMHPFCAPMPVRQAGALDAERAESGAPYL